MSLYAKLKTLCPILFTDFDAGGAFGISFDVKVQAIDSLLRVCG